MMLPCYSKETIYKKRKMSKRIFSFEGDYSWDGSFIYEYLKIKVYNSLVNLYNEYLIDEFDLYLDQKKVFITTYSHSYPINFIERFEAALYNNGFNSWNEDILYLYDITNHIVNSNIEHIKNKINSFIYNHQFDTYEFINIEMM